MKIEANVNAPFDIKEIETLQGLFQKNDIYCYLGIDSFVVINLGKRKYNYNKRPNIEQVVKKIEYIIKNNI